MTIDTKATLVTIAIGLTVGASLNAAMAFGDKWMANHPLPPGPCRDQVVSQSWYGPGECRHQDHEIEVLDNGTAVCRCKEGDR